MIVFLQNTLRFVLLLLAQVFILNNIRFLGFINPYIYILFIFLLPVKFPRWISLILAFVLGLILDVFSNTYGIHAFTSVLIAFLRNPVINMYTSIEEGASPTPSFYTFGVVPFIKYVSTLVIFHHTVLLLLEVFSFNDFGDTLLRIVLNSLVTILIILGIQSFYRK